MPYDSYSQGNVATLTTKQILCRSITDVLSYLGDSTMQEVIWQLNQKGISLNSEEFNIKQFEDALRELFGDGADVMLDLIYYKLNNRLSQLVAVPKLEPRYSPMEKIVKLIENWHPC